MNYAEDQKWVENLPIFQFEKPFAAVVLPTKQVANREKTQLISKTSTKKKTQITQTPCQTHTYHFLQ